MVQPLSIRSELERGVDRRAGDPRRYFMQKKIIGRKIPAIKSNEIRVNAKNNASTSCELVDACGGKRRKRSMSQLIWAFAPVDLRAIQKTHHPMAARKPRLAMRKIVRMSPPYLPVIGL